VASAGREPVFVSFNATFDWPFINWYFHNFRLGNPFGIGGLDMKAFYMGLSGCTWEQTRSSQLPAKYRGKAKHTHNALDDAIEQGEMFESMALEAGVIIKEL
jgi:DNA polymerase III alpha subunit (gram-positive type)